MHETRVAESLSPVCVLMLFLNPVFALAVTPSSEPLTPKLVLVFFCEAEALQGGRDWTGCKSGLLV